MHVVRAAADADESIETASKKLREQIDCFFSDAHLANDPFLKSKMTPGGFVSASVLLTFTCVKAIIGAMRGLEDRKVFLVNACASSEILEVDRESLAVRRKEPLSDDAQSNIDALTVLVHPIPMKATIEELMSFFSEFGTIRAVRRRLEKYALVVFDSAQSCDGLVAAPPTYAGERLNVVKKTDCTIVNPQPAMLQEVQFHPLWPVERDTCLVFDSAKPDDEQAARLIATDVERRRQQRSQLQLAEEEERCHDPDTSVQGTQRVARKTRTETGWCIARQRYVRRKVDMNQRKHKDVVPPPEVAVPPCTSKAPSPDDTWCSICKCNVPQGGMKKHERGNGHVVALVRSADVDFSSLAGAGAAHAEVGKNTHAADSVLTETGWCRVCQCKVGRSKEKAHFNSRKHKDAVSTQCTDVPLAALTFCSICKCDVPPGGMKKHVGKQKHIANVVRVSAHEPPDLEHNDLAHVWVDGHHTPIVLLEFPLGIIPNTLSDVLESPGLESCKNAVCAGPHVCGEVHFAKINVGGDMTDVRHLQHTPYFLRVSLGMLRPCLHRACSSKRCRDTTCTCVHRASSDDKSRWFKIASQSLSLPGLTSLHEAVALHPHVQSRQLPPGVAGPNDNSTSDGFSIRDAANNGDLGTIRNILSSQSGQSPVSKSDANGWTALHNAVFHNEEEIVDVLLQHGASVTAETNHGLTALHLAASIDTGSFGIGETLLRAGADSNAATHSGWTPLHCAVFAGRPRHHAVSTSVERLVAHHASVDAAAHDGSTPLHVAAQFGLVATVLNLIEANADVNTKTVTGATPLLSAAANGHIDVVVKIGSHLPGGTGIGSVTDHRGATALHVAAENGKAGKLFPLRLDPMSLDGSGATALHYAARNGHVSTAKALVKLEDNLLQVRDDAGDSALHAACSAPPSTIGLTATVQFLVDCAVEHTVDRDLKSEGTGALHAAAAAGNAAVVSILLAAGNVPVDSPDMDGWTALQKATRGRHSEVVRVLLSHAASPFERNHEGLAAVDLARLSEDVLLNGAFLDSHVQEASSMVFAASRATVDRMVDFDALRRRLDESEADLECEMARNLGGCEYGRCQIQEARSAALAAARAVLDLPADALPLNDALVSAVRAFEDHLAVVDPPTDDDDEFALAATPDAQGPEQRARAIVQAVRSFDLSDVEAALKRARAQATSLIDAHRPWAGPEGLARAAAVVSATVIVEEDLREVDRFFPGYANADMDVNNFHGVDAFCEAVQLGNLSVASEFLAGNPAIVSLWDSNGVPPLHHATKSGDPHMVKMLLEWGADPLQMDRHDNIAQDHVGDRDAGLLIPIFRWHRSRAARPGRFGQAQAGSTVGPSDPGTPTEATSQESYHRAMEHPMGLPLPDAYPDPAADEWRDAEAPAALSVPANPTEATGQDNRDDTVPREFSGVMGGADGSHGDDDTFSGTEYSRAAREAEAALTRSMPDYPDLHGHDNS